MKTKRLLAVQGPQQFIAGLIAMTWYARQTSPGQEYYSVLLMYDFLMPEHLEAEFVQVINDLANVMPWDKVVFVSGARMRSIMNGKYERAKSQLRDCLSENAFDEIHIGRDFCGDGSPLVLNAYPEGTRLLYGDSFGLVGNEAVCDTFDWRNPVRAAASALKQYVKIRLNGTHQKLPFDAAVLTLPLDWSGEYLNGLDLMVPSRDFVKEKIKSFSDALPALNAYEDSLLEPGQTHFLFLLSNLSASGYMSEAAEIALYVETIVTLAPSGARILIKAHPRAHERITAQVIAGICDRYTDIMIIDSQELSRFPVELWVRLLNECTIVPIFSTSAINLKYFYEQSVVLPLTDTMMKKYCYPDKLDAFQKVYKIIGESVINLDGWDNQSVLWKG